jgi:hypothetical protein
MAEENKLKGYRKSESCGYFRINHLDELVFNLFLKKGLA